MSTSQIQQVEESIRQSREILDLANSLARLKHNSDFRKVMVQGFFKDEAVRLVQEKQNPDKQSPEEQKLLMTQIDSIGSLYQYFRKIETQAEIAGRSLEIDEQTLQELHAESLQ